MNRDMGLCYFCDESSTPNHICCNTELEVLVVTDNGEGVGFLEVEKGEGKKKDYQDKIFPREYSDLESDELSEPFSDEYDVFVETLESKKQFQKENSLKKSENKSISWKYWNLDSSKGKPSNKMLGATGYGVA